MIHHRGNEGKPADAIYHLFRAHARTTSFSADEWSSIEQERYDLAADDPRSAGITGRENPDTYAGEETTTVATGGIDPETTADDPIHGPIPHRRIPAPPTHRR